MKKFAFPLLALCMLAACRERNKIDVKPPVINSVTLNDSTAALHIIHAPSANTLNVSMTDNMGLNQVMVTLTPVDFANPNSTYGPNTGELEYSEIINVNGTNTATNFLLNIPDSIAGHWLITVDLSDEVGYVASPYTCTMRVENDNLPTITATTTPAVTNGVVNMSAGMNLEVFGTIFDEDSLDFAQVRLESLAGQVLGFIDIPFEDTGISFTPTFDDMEAGHYMLVIEGRDKLGYRKLFGLHVIVN